MTDSEFIRMMVSERLAMLLDRKAAPGEKEALDRAEQTLQELEEEKKERIEGYINYLISSEAEAQEAAYLGGFKDGILLMKRICRIGEGGKQR